MLSKYKKMAGLTQLQQMSRKTILHSYLAIDIRQFSTRLGVLYAKTYPWKKVEEPKKVVDPTPVALQYIYQKTTESETPPSLKSGEGSPVEKLGKSLQKLEWDLQALKYKAKILEKRKALLDSENLETSSSPQAELQEGPWRSEGKDEGQRGPSERRVKGFLYGTPDPDFPPTDIPCGGCGAKLHCQDPIVPGYIASEKLKSTDSDQLKSLVCQRCYLITNNNYVLDVTVNEADFYNVIQKIKNERALVLVVVDVTDMKNSIIENLMSHIGIKRPIYVIGNKIDLIPKDQDGYLSRIREELEKCCNDLGLNPSGKNIQHVALVSGKTGYGIEDLITKLMIEWDMKGNIYLVGSANSGKSTLFNALLGSDYCKTDVRDVIKRATVSQWPGTTLQMIKFPIVNPTPWKLARRRKRLAKTRQEDAEVQMIRASRLAVEGRSKNAILSGSIDITDWRKEEAKMNDNVVPSVENWSSIEFKDEAILGNPGVTKRSMRPVTSAADESLFPESKWLNDTPGLLKENQLITQLTAAELRLILQHKIIRPRVFVMKPGETIYISGLAAVEYLQGVTSTFVTVHSGTNIPVHVVRTADAEDFYNNNIGTDVLGIPIGDRERLKKLPPLAGQTFTFTSVSKDFATADIQLSSLGWISICARERAEVTMKAFTPGGRGMYLRQPALLPNFRAFKGRRLSRTAAYSMIKLKI